MINNELKIQKIYEYKKIKQITTTNYQNLHQKNLNYSATFFID